MRLPICLGISAFYGPDHIMDHENIIYIGANFRLGNVYDTTMQLK